MKTPRFTFRFLALTLLAAVLPSGAGLAQDYSEVEEEVLGELYERVMVPEGMTKENLRDTLALILATREWTVQKKSDRKIVGYLKHRGNEATVTLVFGGEAVEIYCEGWAIDKSGNRRKPEQPRGWLKFIHKDINKQFNIFQATH